VLDDYIQGPIVTKDGGSSNSCSDHGDDCACLDELVTRIVTRIDSELSDLDKLLWKSGENAETKARETSIDAATLDADMTGQVEQCHASKDEFIPIDSLFEELCGNDDNDLATNDLAVQASDASAADQAFATTSFTDQIVTEEILNVSGNKMYEDATNIIMVSGKLASHSNR